jgi:hypothetical protein
MGFLDKVKTQAATATSLAKDAAQRGQAKLDAIQAKRAADALLRDLGAVVYGQHTGRASATADADGERLIASLRAHEAEHGPIDLGLEADGSTGAGAAASTATAPPATGSPPPPPPTSQPV